MKRQIFSLLAVLAIAALVGCAKKGEEQPQNKQSSESATQTENKTGEPEQTLNVYSGRTEALVAPVLDAFEKQTGIRIKVKYADTAQLAATLLEEGARTPADVFLAQDASTLALLEAEEALAPLPEGLTGRVAPSFKSKTGHWLGVTGRARVLAYNTEKLEPDDLPKTAAELTDAKWKGRVGWAPENASFQSAISAMIQLEGKDATAAWVKGVQANEPRAYPKNTPAVVAVSRGEVDVALVNHYYLYRLRAEHGDDFPVENHYFRDGSAHSMVNVSGVGVVAASRRQELAHKLVDYLLGEEAQRHFVDENYEFPVISGVKTPLGLPEINSLNAPEIDLAKLEELEATHGILREAGALP